MGIQMYQNIVQTIITDISMFYPDCFSRSSADKHSFSYFSKLA